jgi:hypothetical protein
MSAGSSDNESVTKTRLDLDVRRMSEREDDWFRRPKGEKCKSVMQPRNGKGGAAPPGGPFVLSPVADRNSQVEGSLLQFVPCRPSTVVYCGE